MQGNNAHLYIFRMYKLILNQKKKHPLVTVVSGNPEWDMVTLAALVIVRRTTIII